jgi:hypothetical protein
MRVRPPGFKAKIVSWAGKPWCTASRTRSMRVNGFSRRSFIVLACLSTPLLPVIDGATHFANAQQAEFQNGLAEIAAKHGLNQVWFRAEKNGQVLADVGLGGANPDAPIHVASLGRPDQGRASKWPAWPGSRRALRPATRDAERTCAKSSLREKMVSSIFARRRRLTQTRIVSCLNAPRRTISENQIIVNTTETRKMRRS